MTVVPVVGIMSVVGVGGVEGGVRVIDGRVRVVSMVGVVHSCHVTGRPGTKEVVPSGPRLSRRTGNNF